LFKTNSALIGSIKSLSRSSRCGEAQTASAYVWNVLFRRQ